MQDEQIHKYLRDMFIEYKQIMYPVLSPKSIIHYAQEFSNFCKWASLLDITHSSQVTKEITEKYIRYVYSIKRSAPFEISTLKRVWSITLPYTDNPWNVKILNLVRINTPTPETHRPFTLRECKRIFQFADGDLRNALMFAYWYGMRIGSCCNLKWDDFKGWRRNGRFIHLPPKTARSKPVYIELPIVPEIEALLDSIERSNEYLFPVMHDKYSKYLSVICHEFRQIVKKCGIKNSMLGRASMHSFRSTFITRMDEIGAPSYITDSITGHSPRDMHGIYSKPSAVAKKKWIMRALKPVSIL